MKKISALFVLTFVLGLMACGTSDTAQREKEEAAVETEIPAEDQKSEDMVKIELSNSEILVDGGKISENTEDAVYKANDIIFYLEGQGIEYGGGTAADEHSQTEADAHTVVHITQPGTYELSGTMEAGQIFVDLGEDAREDPDAVVTLYLNNVDITCTVAPAILFYNVYECGDTDTDHAAMDVDIDAAGANLVIADGSSNKMYGSYVAKIYKFCELNEDGTEVVDAKKLHKYDGAVYSKMSMNVYGDTGQLEITAENEGLCSELHMTIHGGNIDIKAGNDGINTNEDGVSVFAMNGGNINITVTGETGEGDGIDSNGWVIINGGTVNVSACAFSQDSGLDSDNGIYINGGTICASGNMIDEISGGEQAYMAFRCRESQEAGKLYEVRDTAGNVIMEVTPTNAFTMLVVSSEKITSDGAYTLWMDDTQIAEGMQGGMRDREKGGKMRPDREPPEGMERPEGENPPEKPKEPRS